MPEVTTATPVTQEAPTVEQRMARFLEQHDEDSKAATEPPKEKPAAPPPVKAEEAPQDPVPVPEATEPTAEDLPDPQEATGEQSASDEFEIVHNGQQVKLTRAKVIELTQQGFDYTQKSQAVAEHARALQAREQRLAEVEQVQPMLLQDMALVRSLEAQLAPYARVDWVGIATSDPLGYPVERAKFDTLLQGYQQAVGQYQQKSQFVEQRRHALRAQNLEQEAQSLVRKIPAWAEAAKYDTESKQLKQYLISEGASPDQVESLDSSVAVAIAYKAWKYDQLVKNKASKAKELRTAPPVTRPGASQPSTETSDKTQALSRKAAKTDNMRDWAAVLADRWK